MYSILFNQSAKEINEERRVVSEKFCWTNWIPKWKTMNFNLYFT